MPMVEKHRNGAESKGGFHRSLEETARRQIQQFLQDLLEQEVTALPHFVAMVGGMFTGCAKISIARLPET